MQNKLIVPFTDMKADDSTRTIEGYGSIFGNVDSYDDIVLPGAFAKSIAERMPAMLWQHDSREVPGVWLEARETDQGLYLKGEIIDTTLGDNVYKLARKKAITGLSIGYSPVKYKIDNETGIRRLEEVELWEVSLVTFPANELAQITSVKNKPATERDLERLLRDAGGYSHREAKAIVAGGFKGIATQRDVEQQMLQDINEMFNQITA